MSDTRDEIVRIAGELVDDWAQRPEAFNVLTLEQQEELTAAVVAHRYAMLDAINADTPGSSVAGSPPTSRDAAMLIMPRRGSIRRRILVEIAARSDGLMTDEMLERELRMKHQTVSSARNSLTLQGFLKDSGQKAETSSGRKAVLWRLTEDGLDVLVKGLNNGTTPQG